MKHTEYLIIGGGIAGVMLAWHLIQAGRDVLIIDNADPCSATRVAGGMINPVTGKRLVLSWRYDAFYAYNTAFYPRLEKVLKTSFYTPLIIRRIFKNAGQANDWLLRQNDPQYQPYIAEDAPLPPCFNAPYGSARIHRAAGVQPAVLLKALYAYFGERLLVQDVYYGDVEPAARNVRVGNIVCRHCLFCEGWRGMHNPWFRFLPFNPSKGDVLTLGADTLPHEAVAAGEFLLPQNNALRCGSTYIWDRMDCTPEPLQARKLLNRVGRFYNRPLRIIDHKAGIRPTVKGRRPFLGRHPVEKRLWIFNGLGTKGLSLAPLLARNMTRRLLEGAALDPETDIARYV